LLAKISKAEKEIQQAKSELRQNKKEKIPTSIPKEQPKLSIFI